MDHLLTVGVQDLTELDKDTCAPCRTINGPAWEAKYDGTCGVCEGPIDVGDKVRWTESGGAVQHASHR